MNRLDITAALAPALPLLMALPFCAVLASIGVAPWAVVWSVPVAAAVYAAVGYLRISRDRRRRGPGPG
ncbi:MULTISPECIES: hypothetical protein [Streptomyces]|uniref:DUF3311 domain-containing protein n=1 Tax=Streptomyces luteosporeus TaxID=173856 RepID=A0ABN3TSA8_9ACTN